MLELPKELEKEFIYKVLDTIIKTEIYLNDCVQFYGDSPTDVKKTIKPLYKNNIQRFVKLHDEVISKMNNHNPLLYFVLANLCIVPENVIKDKLTDKFCMSLKDLIEHKLSNYLLESFKFFVLIDDFGEEELVYISEEHAILWENLNNSFLTFCQEVDTQKYINILLKKYKHKVNKNPKKRVKTI